MEKKELRTIIHFANYGLLGFGILVGFLIGSSIQKTVEVEVFVDDRLQKCQELGGEYTLRYDYLDKDYYEKCEVPEKEIDLSNLKTKEDGK